jgi:hypothetical protein
MFKTFVFEAVGLFAFGRQGKTGGRFCYYTGTTPLLALALFLTTERISQSAVDLIIHQRERCEDVGLIDR